MHFMEKEIDLFGLSPEAKEKLLQIDQRVLDWT